MGVVIRRWVWLESIGVVSGCFPHITYISLLLLYLLFFAAASLLLFSFCYIYRFIYIKFSEKMKCDVRLMIDRDIAEKRYENKVGMSY